MSLKLAFDTRAEADLEDLPPKVCATVWRRLQGLKGNPQGPSTRPLAGDLQGLRRLRIGDYRAAYYVEGDTVFVLAVGHRSRFYEIAKRRAGA